MTSPWASTRVRPRSWAPATVRWPPPPRASMTNCTLIFAFRAGADTDAVIGQIIEGKAGFDAVDVDEHIRYLGGDNGGIALTLGAAGHGDAVADLGTGQDEGPVLDGIEVRAEQFADDVRIRSAAAQIRRGVESAHAGLDGEVLGVDDDAGIEGRRFDLR